jgi:hypothetical protein
MTDTPTRLHFKVTMDDGAVYAAAIDERDMRRWDMTYRRMQWPPMEEAKVLFQGFIAAAALIRQGDLEGVPERLVDHIVHTDPEGEETINPTGAAPGQD